MNCDKKDLLLYAVTDRAWLGDKTLSWQVEESLKGGATMIQLREKHLDHEHFLKEAKEIKELCRKYQVPFLINDDVDLAVEVDADGVHVGQHDMEAGEAPQKDRSKPHSGCFGTDGRTGTACPAGRGRLSWSGCGIPDRNQG